MRVKVGVEDNNSVCRLHKVSKGRKQRVRLTHEEVDTDSSSASCQEEDEVVRVRLVVFVHHLLAHRAFGVPILGLGEVGPLNMSDSNSLVEGTCSPRLPRSPPRCSVQAQTRRE